MTFVFVYVSSNLYKQVKLLSLGDEIALPPLPREDLLPGLRGGADDSSNEAWDLLPNTNSRMYGGTPVVFPTIAFLGMAIVLVYLVRIIYKNKTKPRRRRPKLRRFHNVTYGVKVPGV